MCQGKKDRTCASDQITVVVAAAVDVASHWSSPGTEFAGKMPPPAILCGLGISMKSNHRPDHAEQDE
jgi:hypothetical protein